MKVALLILSVALANAEIVDSAQNGFTVRTTLNIKAQPADVYGKIVHDLGEWWNTAHTVSGDAHNLRIETRPGGCFCEKLPNDGFIRHMDVIFVMPGKRIVMSGALGPLQSLAATGSLQINVLAEAGRTKLDVIYAVTGYLPLGINTWAIPADLMLEEQFTRLKKYVETGSPK